MAMAMEGRGRKNVAAKFDVRRNPALTAALTANSLRPSISSFFFILSLFSASLFSLLSFLLRENDGSNLTYVSQHVAYIFFKLMQALMTLVFIGSFFALLKAISLWKKTKVATLNLSNRQLELLGMKPKAESNEPYNKAKPSITLVPLHQPFTSPGHTTTRITNGRLTTSSGIKMMHSFTTLPSLYLVPSHSPGLDHVVSSTPWLTKRASSFTRRTPSTVQQLETFLADFDEKFSTSAAAKRMATPPPTGTNTTRMATPLRHVRMSPASWKFSPLKNDMSMEESIDAFNRLGVYPQIEQWRDAIRQWFSSMLLNPLLSTIETSHIKVMEAASKLGISLTITKVGTVTSSQRNYDWQWQLAYTPDEEGLLVQLRTTLVQHNPSNPVIQDCIDAITQHQKLLALMKGEWEKGTLPQTHMPADYTVQRIRELTAGTCVKNYEYINSSRDSHLLLYLFCAFLEHPKWMLDAGYTSHAGVQNPLFFGLLPSKEGFPDKYLAVTSGVPSVLHPGACLLAVGKQSPPVFALYWDGKPQFSFEGRTALWDAVLLFCHKIKTDYGGIVRGMRLGSSGLGILPILDSGDAKFENGRRQLRRPTEEHKNGENSRQLRMPAEEHAKYENSRQLRRPAEEHKIGKKKPRSETNVFDDLVATFDRPRRKRRLNPD